MCIVELNTPGLSQKPMGELVPILYEALKTGA